MSSYYQYQFVSAEQLIALLSEELKSYLDSGAIDTTVWPIYVDEALNRLGKGTKQILGTVISICDSEGRLPDDFNAVREAWLCTSDTTSYQLPSAHYEQVNLMSTSTMLNRYPDNSCESCDACSPETIKAVYKTTFEVMGYFQKQYLLRPGNINTRKHCSGDCANFNSSSSDTFDIHGNKIVTNFPTGSLYLLYYSKEYDETGYQLIPDNYNIKEFIKATIRSRVFEQLSNQVTDETYNQINQKAFVYKQREDEAYIIAYTETKKETVYDKQKATQRAKKSLNKYRIR